jgi:hypothetical protein
MPPPIACPLLNFMVFWKESFNKEIDIRIKSYDRYLNYLFNN